MSAKWMGHFFDDTDLEGSELLLALAIADHADSEGRSWPGYTLLAKKIRLGERQTRVLVKALETAGHVEVVRGSGRGHRSFFQLKKVQCSAPIKDAQRELPTSPFNEEEEKGQQSAALSDKGGSAASGKGEAPRQEKGQCGVPTHINQIINQKGEPGKAAPVSLKAIESDMPKRSEKHTFGSRHPLKDIGGRQPLPDVDMTEFGPWRDEVEDWYCSKLGIVRMGTDATTAEALSWLFENKFTLDDIKGFYTWATTDPEEKRWRKGGVTLSAIAKGIAVWRATKKKVSAPLEPVDYSWCANGCDPATGYLYIEIGGEWGWKKCEHVRKAA